MLLNVVTFNLASAAFLVIEANWVRKVRERRVALWLASAHATVTLIVIFGFSHKQETALSSAASTLMFVLWIATVYWLRYELTQEPIGIPLGWVMPLFFGPVYFQYHIADYGYHLGTGLLGLRTSQDAPPTSEGG